MTVESVYALGMQYDEIEEELKKKLNFAEKQTATAEELLVQVNTRLLLENEMISSRLQGIDQLAPIYAAERENLFGLIVMMQIRALNEHGFEDASLCVGLTERLLYHQPGRSV